MKNILRIIFLVINIILLVDIQQTDAKDFTIQNNDCTIQFLVNTNKIIEVEVYTIKIENYIVENN